MPIFLHLQNLVMLFSLAALPLAFTAPSAHLAPSTRAPAASMVLIGLKPLEWPKETDPATLGEFVHTRVPAPATTAPSVPVDSVPRMIGMARSAWPDVYDKDSTMGEFFLTRVAAPQGTTAPKARAPIIGMSRRAWPVEYGDRADPTDPTQTLGGFVHTRVISTDAEGRVVPTPAAPFVKAVAEPEAEPAAEVA